MMHHRWQAQPSLLCKMSDLKELKHGDQEPKADTIVDQAVKQATCGQILECHAISQLQCLAFRQSLQRGS